MAPPIPAANPARIARTAVRERVVIPPALGLGVNVTVLYARAVRLARAAANWVAAPEVGVMVTAGYPPTGVVVSDWMRVPIWVGDGSAVEVMVWKGGVGVMVTVRVGVDDL